ncbi:hypothetical protein AB836_00575 [Rickettsiales bacterium (ex Bugula neritina AB1)]|nr:hypothetical protein AB836_00575 [Rickettsiales bacterium (ex Bugula neritina AB1)]
MSNTKKCDKKLNFFEYDIPNDVFHNINNEEVIGIDTEALGLNIRRDRLCLVQICVYGKEQQCKCYVVHFPESKYEKSKNLIKLFRNKKIKKIFHFARFDMSIIQQYLKVLPTNIICTKIMSKLSRTFTERHGLKELCRELLGVELNKTSGCSYWGGVLTQQQQQYAINDVVYLKDLSEKLKSILIKEKRWKLAELAFKALEMVVTMDLSGFDPVYIINHH